MQDRNFSVLQVRGNHEKVLPSIFVLILEAGSVLAAGLGNDGCKHSGSYYSINNILDAGRLYQACIKFRDVVQNTEFTIGNQGITFNMEGEWLSQE